jgi:hypothetical protein
MGRWDVQHMAPFIEDACVWIGSFPNPFVAHYEANPTVNGYCGHGPMDPKLDTCY